VKPRFEFPKARRTAFPLRAQLVQRSRKRTSALADAVHIDASAGTVTLRKKDGLTPATIVDRYAASTAGAIPIANRRGR